MLTLTASGGRQRCVLSIVNTCPLPADRTPPAVLLPAAPHCRRQVGRDHHAVQVPLSDPNGPAANRGRQPDQVLVAEAGIILIPPFRVARGQGATGAP